MRAALLIIVLTGLWVSAAEMKPAPEACAAIFQGEVVSVRMVQAMTNYPGLAYLHSARVRVGTVTKEDTKLGSEAVIYYVYCRDQICPRPVFLQQGQHLGLYCVRRTFAGLTNVLWVPSESFVQRAQP